MRRSGNAGRGSASARNEDGLMPIVPVSLPDSQAPPPDESVGPIPGPTLLMPSYPTLEIFTAVLLFDLFPALQCTGSVVL